jgi:hypothetical protein
VEARLLEAVSDFGDVAQAQRRAGVGREHHDVAELLGPLLALLHPQQDLAGAGLDGAGGDVLAGAGDDVGHLAQRQPVLAQAGERNLDVGHVVRRIADLDLGDGRVGDEAIAQPLGEHPQRPDVHVAVQPEFHDLALARLQTDLGFLDVVGKGADPVDRLVDLLERLHPVGARDQFDGDAAGALAGRGRDLADALHPLDRLLDRQQDPLFDLRWRRAGIGDADLDDVQLELGEDLLLNCEGGPQAATEQHQHGQVGGHRVAGHPGDGPRVLVVA